jgi:transaldolase
MQEIGQSVWLDALSRDDIQTGDLKLFIQDGILGATSNPNMVQQVITASSYYNQQISELLPTTDDPRKIFHHLAATDVRNACDLFMPTYERTERRDDGCVSMQVDPQLAYDTEGTNEQTKLLWEMVDRPNLFIQIPSTREGLPAIEECVAQGISISPVEIFSIERYREVAQAYIRGLHRLVEAGGDLSKMAAVAHFFVSRVDIETDNRLEDIGRQDLKGKLGVANAQLAYQEFKQIFSTDEWAELESEGASKQRLLWASTTIKNLEYRPMKYVEGLIGPDTATTLTKETLAHTMDRVDARPTLEEGVDEARRIFEAVEEAGVDYGDVNRVLEEKGIRQWIHSDEKLVEEVRQRSDLLGREI